MAIPILLVAFLVLMLHLDQRRSERDWRDEENSVAAGFKRWLVGTNNRLPVAARKPVVIAAAEKTLLRVSGNVPPEAWAGLGTALLSNVPDGAQVSAALDVSLAIDENQVQAVTARLNALISNLELSELRVARVAPPRKARARVVIRFREISPLLQSLLCVNHWPDASRVGQL